MSVGKGDNQQIAALKQGDAGLVVRRNAQWNSGAGNARPLQGAVDLVHSLGGRAVDDARPAQAANQLGGGFDLQPALGRLDEEARVLIVMREVDDLSYEEIADTLGLPLPTVKTRLFRARRALKDALKEWR